MKRTKTSKIKKKGPKSQKKVKTFENDKGLKGEPEVFVLPPDLLHKLGIDLRVVQENNQNSNDYNADINTNHSCNGAKTLCSTNSSSQEDTPITKTAKLVKDTVFLSPTFIPFANNLSGEIEIANVFHEEEIIRVNEVLLNNESLSTHSSPNNNRCTYSNFSEEHINKNICVLESNDTEVISDIQTEKKDCNADNICIESYESSDFSLDSSQILNDDKHNIINSECKNSQKINIISEEIIEDSQLQELKNKLSPNKDFFVPVDINTIILQPLENTIKTSSISDDCILQCKNIESIDISNMPIQIISPLMVDIEEFDFDNEASPINNIKCIVESTENINVDTENIHNNTFEANEFTEIDVKLISNCVDSDNVSEFNVETYDYIMDVKVEQGHSNPFFLNESFDSDACTNISPNTVCQKSISIDFDNLNKQDKVTSESDVLIKSNEVELEPLEIQVINKPITKEVNDTVINMEHENNDQNENKGDILLDKVAEIAMYLSTYTNAQCNRKKKAFQAKFHKKKGSPVKLKYKSPKSKLFIQGVEKPGGWCESDGKYSAKDFKTYRRNGTVTKYSKKYYQCEMYNTATSVLNIDLDISKNVYITEEFCSCERFGKLKFDVCNIIEHNIHCEKRSRIDNKDILLNSNCEYRKESFADNIEIDNPKLERNCKKTYQLDPVLAEFNETNTFKEFYSLFESNTDYTIYSLSFNERKFDSSHGIIVTENLDITQNMACEGAVGTMKDNKGLKRLRSTETIEVEGQPSKASVKCGICNALLAETEWDFHVDTEHCCIAWRHGETLDLNNLKLVSKLKARISNGEKLKCSICGIEYSCEKKILKHVPKCLKVQEISRSRKFLDLKPEDKRDSIEIQSKVSTLKCGVCSLDVEEREWLQHIQSAHNYLAWKDGQSPINLNDEEAVINHLNDITKQYKELTLTCYKCGVTLKRVKSYVKHMKNCSEDTIANGTNSSVNTSTANTSITHMNDDINTLGIETKCGVCLQSVDPKNWFNHMAMEHDYMAWKYGESPPNLEDSEAIYKHLNKINKKLGGLNCSKCSFKGKYVKPYLKHLKNCEGTETSSISALNNDTMDDFLNTESTVKICGVCRTQVESKLWVNHLSKIHNYLAWEEGQPTFDTTDPLAINSHLHSMLKTFGTLICGKCGLVKRSVKIYTQHVTSCTETYDLFEGEKQVTCKSEILECALCFERVPAANWRMHAMKKHYNIAWAIGEEPIDLKNISVIEKYLKKYKQNVKNLVCLNCQLSRASYHGFYAHIIACGKTDEETDMFKNVCDICNGKYLFIYKNQHMAMHREQEYAKERKIKAAKNKSAESDPQIDGDTPRRRKAAEKAQKGLKEYKSNTEQYKYNCSTCGFGSDDSDELLSHKCGAAKAESGEGEWDASVQVVGGSEDSDSDVVSDASNEHVALKRVRVRSHPVPSQQKLPFQVNDIKSFFQKCDEDFEKYHYTNDTLYPEWKKFSYQVTNDNVYIPPLNESCKVHFGKDNWKNLKRFEAVKNHEGRGYTMFVGGSVQRVSWVPDVRIPEVEKVVGGEGSATSEEGAGVGVAGAAKAAGGPMNAWLSVSCHNGPDVPRLLPEDVSPHHTMIQIWDFGDFKTLPKFSFGIALDYGTVWSMSWCPSGACDKIDNPADQPTDQIQRLGLLAIACSNGSAYVISVPYPSSIVKDEHYPIPVYKFKPVAELRLFTSSERIKYQATSISWSKQRGHTVVVVGYADGTLAYYDLATSSVLLRTVEDEVDILYPFDDERPHNTSVLDVDLYPGGEWGARGRGGAVRSAGPTGARAGRGAARAPVPAAALAPLPHWPSVQLAGDELLVSSLVVNELEWCGGGRRLGGARAGAAGRGGRAASFAGRALRLLRTHPAHNQLNKKLIGVLQMVPLNNKKSKKTNDNLSMKVEPLTYEEAIKKYGIEYKINQEVQKQQDICPERFPLGDVTSMSFCESRAHCDWLALATHSGVLFVVTT